MSDESTKPGRTRGVPVEAKADPFLSKVPQSVWDQVYEHRREREHGRQLLVQQLETYDTATQENESLILQVYEMSLQSRSQKRDRDTERER